MTPASPRRKPALYPPPPGKSFRLSRSKIDLFLECPRCFYLDRRLGIPRPGGMSFSLNNAVDALLKREFDRCRANCQPHPIMTANGINAVPFQHPQLDIWRDSLHRGVEHYIPALNVTVTGGVDDVWITPTGELHVVDYKATSTTKEITLDEDWKRAYKRQVEIYQWLFRRNNFKVSPTAYFVYCNGQSTRPGFDARLDFNIKLIPYIGDDSWVEGTVVDIVRCLSHTAPPPAGEECDFCGYIEGGRAVGNDG